MYAFYVLHDSKNIECCDKANALLIMQCAQFSKHQLIIGIVLVTHILLIAHMRLFLFSLTIDTQRSSQAATRTTQHMEHERTHRRKGLHHCPTDRHHRRHGSASFPGESTSNPAYPADFAPTAGRRIPAKSFASQTRFANEIRFASCARISTAVAS